MDPIRKVESIEALADTLGEYVARLRAEATDAAVRWDRLCRMGGRRADQAAEILATLSPHLQRIEAHARNCSIQIERMRRDPFERECGPIAPTVRSGR